MLYTNLKHIETATDYHQAISENENVVVICGNMGHMSVPVYRMAEGLKKQYSHIKFYDMEFDNPESHVIRDLPEVGEQIAIPFMVFYKTGNMVKVTSDVHSKAQVKEMLDKEFSGSVIMSEANNLLKR
jgi:thioredoxin 1